MDWANEQYILVYIRDSGDWLMWSWQTRAVMLFLLRKVNRAGILDLGKGKLRALAKILEMPEIELSEAIAPLLEDGCVQIHEEKLIIPNFIPAQEAKHSDKARKQMSRERERARLLSHAVTGCHTESHEVTLPYPTQSNPSESNSDARAESRTSERRLKSVPPPKLEPSEAAAPESATTPDRSGDAAHRKTAEAGAVASGGSGGYAIASRVWHELWQAKYRRAYEHSGRYLTGPQSEDAVFVRLGGLAMAKGNPGAAEAYLRHKISAYLKDHGDRGWLDENCHPLRTIERSWNKYGEPKEPKRMVPRRDEEPVELVSVEEMARRAAAAMTAGIGKPEADRKAGGT